MSLLGFRRKGIIDFSKRYELVSTCVIYIKINALAFSYSNLVFGHMQAVETQFDAVSDQCLHCLHKHTYVSPSAFLRRTVVGYWRKYVHEVLVNRLGGLSLPRKSVVSLTDRPDMTLDVYRGRKTTIQQHCFNETYSNAYQNIKK